MDTSQTYLSQISTTSATSAPKKEDPATVKISSAGLRTLLYLDERASISRASAEEIRPLLYLKVNRDPAKEMSENCLAAAFRPGCKENVEEKIPD